jgi:hypothetical protein
MLGISYDLAAECDVIALRTPDSTGAETVVNCGTLEPYEDETES